MADPVWADGTTPALSAANLSQLMYKDGSNAVAPTLPSGTTIGGKSVILSDGTNSALTQDNISYDATEAISASETVDAKSNLKRLRQAAAILVGSTWSAALANTKAAILSDGTNAGVVVTLNRLYRRPSGTPTLGTATGNISTGSSTVTGNDEHGQIAIVTSGSTFGLGAGGFIAVTVTFSGAYPGTPTVVLTPQGIVTAVSGIVPTLGAVGTTTFQIQLFNLSASSITIPASTTIMTVNYITQY